MYCNRKEGHGVQSAVGLGQIGLDKLPTTVNCGVLVVYPAHDLLLNFNMQLRRKLISNGHSLVGLRPVYYEESEGTWKSLK